MILIFIILAIFIVISIIYAAINFVANERAIRRSEVNRNRQLERTILDITTTCRKVKDATDDNKTLQKLLIELEETRRFLKKYY